MVFAGLPRCVLKRLAQEEKTLSQYRANREKVYNEREARMAIDEQKKISLTTIFPCPLRALARAALCLSADDWGLGSDHREKAEDRIYPIHGRFTPAILGDGKATAL